MSIPNYQLIIHDETEFRLAYLPFIQGGGWFIKTAQTHQLQERIQLDLNWMTEPYHFLGRIVWLVPTGVLNGPGIGVQLEDQMFFQFKVAHYLQNLS